MSCEYCNHTLGHASSCPLYSPARFRPRCAICDDAIYDGERYIENDDGEYAHVDCLWRTEELAKFLGACIQEMDCEEKI